MRFNYKRSDTSLWNNTSKINKMNIVVAEDEDIEISAILIGKVN